MEKKVSKVLIIVADLNIWNEDEPVPFSGLTVDL